MTMYAVASLIGGTQYVCGLCLHSWYRGNKERAVRVPENKWTVCVECAHDNKEGEQ
jgi:hypothetical protein